MENASDERDQARLRAAFSKESGAWLQALPVSSLGLRMDDNTVRVAIGLRLGSPLCRPHICHHCGVEVDCSATHGLHCRWSEGRHYRHATLCTVHCLQPKFLPAWNRLASTAQMERDLMALQWSLGRGVSCWSGTPPAQTLLLHRTLPTQQGKREQLLLWQRREKRLNTNIWMPHTVLFQLQWRQREPLALRPELF